MRKLRISLRVARWCLYAGRVALVSAAAASLVLACVQCSILRLQAQTIGEAPTLADYLAYLVVGIPQPEPGVFDPSRVSVPFAWMLFVLIPHALVIAVAAGARFKANLAVATQHRGCLWFGQCLAVLIAAVMVWVVACGSCTAYALLFGAEPTLEASELFISLALVSDTTLAMPPYVVSMAVFACAVVSCGLCLLQLGLAELCGHRLAFLFVAAVLGASVFAMTPLLVGNLMMLARSNVFVISEALVLPSGSYQPGISPALALDIATCLAVAGVFCGWRVGKKRDYLGVDGK